MNRFPTGHEAFCRPALVRGIAAALLVCALLVPPCLAGGGGSQTTDGDSVAGYGFFLGFAPLQVATKAPVNVSTTPVVAVLPVTTPAPQTTQTTSPPAPPPQPPEGVHVVTTQPFSVTLRPTVMPALTSIAFETSRIFCAFPNIQCGGSCVNTKTDKNNCGQCGHSCGSSQCCNGTCSYSWMDNNNCGACGTVCPYGMCCDGRCVNWNEFDANCGSCGKICRDNRTCVWGVNECLYHCIGTDGVERYLYHLNSDDNCGGCNIQCTGGTHCANGRCWQNCAEDSVLCNDNTCVPRSIQNCAYCGNACRPGETCTNGRCTCPEGWGICDNTCVELGTRSHCSGNCQPCPAGYECMQSVGAYATYGTCMQDCPYGYLSCGDGSCKNALVDRSNCGACGTACAAGQYCINGACTNTCPAGSMDCQNDGTCDNPSIDPRNCGACGNSCPNQTDLCVNGVCQYYCNIPAIYENRCFNESVGGPACSDKRTDSLNCDGCGRYCNLHETCVDAECVDTCPAGTHWCDDAGCINIMSDRNNCGSCGKQCGVVCWYGSCWPW